MTYSYMMEIEWPWPSDRHWYFMQTLVEYKHIEVRTRVKSDIFFIWPWLWPNHFHTQTWPRYGQDVYTHNELPYLYDSKVYPEHTNTHREMDRL